MGPYALVVAPVGVKFGTEEGTLGPLLRVKFHPHRCNVSPLRGEKSQNRPLSKLNTGRFALRAMLPVKMSMTAVSSVCVSTCENKIKTKFSDCYITLFYAINSKFGDYLRSAQVVMIFCIITPTSQQRIQVTTPVTFNKV